MVKSTYSFDTDLKPIVQGVASLPNFQQIEARMFLDNIAAVGHGMEPYWGHAMLNGRRQWAMYFLTGEGMSSPPHSYGGGGYVAVYGGIHGTFAICRHEKRPDPGANPSRGWHPGRCAKCGIDMTVDSGD